jgi:hypothetical protein
MAFTINLSTEDEVGVKAAAELEGLEPEAGLFG